VFLDAAAVNLHDALEKSSQPQRGDPRQPRASPWVTGISRMSPEGAIHQIHHRALRSPFQGLRPSFYIPRALP
jgi:hypothetical protein